VEPSDKLIIRFLCELLDIHAVAIYYAPAKESEMNLEVMRLLDDHYLERPTHGVLQMQDYLKEAGYHGNHMRVRRLLRLMGLMAVYPKKNLSKLGHAEYIYPYLHRNLEIGRPSQVWEIDITYFQWRRVLCTWQPSLMYIAAMW
jgi:putative transposase